jgi:predicted site-specific integrase-resolvase
VSSAKQKDDLQRQKAAMSAAYPGHLVISDVGSGLNFNRPGLRALLERSMRGEVAEVVVSHRDRLARFATELIEWILRLHGTRLVVQHQVLETPESELVADLLAIVTVFACRSHGRRRYRRPTQGQEAQGV